MLLLVVGIFLLERYELMICVVFRAINEGIDGLIMVLILFFCLEAKCPKFGMFLVGFHSSVGAQSILDF